MNIITIARQFGSGGRSIGRELSQRLGIPCYDKEFVKKVALETGFDEKFIEDRGEHVQVGAWFGSGLGAHSMAGSQSIEDFLWSVQSKIILDLAEKGPCIIIGRCASYLLRNRSDVISAFIHAPVEDRAKRIVKLYGESDVKPEKRLEEKDKKRKLYWLHYTGLEWGASENYDICLNSSKLGIEGCVNILERLGKGES